MAKADHTPSNRLSDTPSAPASVAARIAAEFPILETTAFKALAVRAMLAALQGDPVSPGTLEHAALECLRLSRTARPARGASRRSLRPHVAILTAALAPAAAPAFS